MIRGFGSTKSLILGAVLALASAQISAADSPFSTLPEQHGTAVVTVRYLVQVNMPGVNQELDRKIRCLMIDPTGLVLCASSEIGDSFGVMARLFGRSPDPISSRPRDLRVEIDGREEEWSGRLVAKDTDRDLAWVVLQDVPDDQRFSYIDFTTAGRPKAGEQIYLLRRMNEFFGDEAVIAEATVAARLTRPRPLYLLSQSLGHLGMAAFDGAGRPVGVMVTQVPAEGEGEPVMQNRGLPGQATAVSDMISRVILPASEVVKATQLAKETWQADQEENLQ